MRPSLAAKLRLALPVLVGIVFLSLMSTSGYAQTAGGASDTTVNQGQGLFGIIAHNLDPVFFTILILSIVGLTFIIQGFIQNRTSVLMPESSTVQIREMIAQRRFADLAAFTEADPSFISKALHPALKRAPSFASMKEAMETAIGEQTAEQFRKIEYLNIIGNLGPLLGLLGTVLGMIAAFSQMNANAGNTSPTVLAGGISKALCHTFLGLVLAVPCLAAFGVLRTIVDRLTVQGALLAEELLFLIRPAEAKPGSNPPAGVRPGVPQPAASPAVAPTILRKPSSPQSHTGSPNPAHL